MARLGRLISTSHCSHDCSQANPDREDRLVGQARAGQAPQRGGTDSAVERFHPHSAPCRRRYSEPTTEKTPSWQSVPVCHSVCACALPGTALHCCTDCALSVPEHYLPFVRLCCTYRTRCVPYLPNTSCIAPRSARALASTTRRHRSHCRRSHSHSQTHRPEPRTTTHCAQLPDATAESDIATETPRVPVVVVLLHGRLARGTARVRRRRFPTRAPSTPP